MLGFGLSRRRWQKGGFHTRFLVERSLLEIALETYRASLCIAVSITVIQYRKMRCCSFYMRLSQISPSSLDRPHGTEKMSDACARRIFPSHWRAQNVESQV